MAAVSSVILNLHLFQVVLIIIGCSSLTRTKMLGEEDESSSCLASLLLRQQLTTTCIRGFSGSARRRVVEWLVDLVKEEGENMDMVALTVTIIDMLSIQVRKHQLQLLAGAALLIASKSRARSLTMNRILFYLDTAGTRDTLLVWEKLILLSTKFNISVVVPHDFLSHLLSLYSNLLRPYLSYVASCCSQLLSLSCMDQTLSTSIPSLQATSAIFLTMETEDNQITFLTEVKRILGLEKDEIISCARLLENVLIQTMPEDPILSEKKKRKNINIQTDDDSARMKEPNHTILTPHKSELILGKISNHTSTPRKSPSRLKFKSECSENKENDDSAIAKNMSLLDNLCLSSPPSSSSSSRESSTKSSPDSGASVSSYRARL
jgi:hypothetical protein